MLAPSSVCMSSRTARSWRDRRRDPVEIELLLATIEELAVDLACERHDLLVAERLGPDPHRLSVRLQRGASRGEANPCDLGVLGA